jgi:hypothetical protein
VFEQNDRPVVFFPRKKVLPKQKGSQSSEMKQNELFIRFSPKNVTFGGVQATANT